MESTITSFEAAFKAEGLDINKLPEVSHLENESDQKDAILNYKLNVVVRALNNEGQKKPWKPDYANSNQTKWENRYYFAPGSGWSLNLVGAWATHARCGSRRVFREQSIGIHFWNHFSDHIKETL